MNEQIVFPLNLDTDSLNVICAALRDLPWKVANPVLTTIHQQTEAHFQLLKSEEEKPQVESSS